MIDTSVWKKCNICKKPIAYNTVYWVCNVSTCNRKRTGLIFCNVSCWDAHLPMMNHRESWAEERRAPTAAEWKLIQSGELSPPKNKTPRSNDSQNLVASSKPEKPDPSPPAHAATGPVILKKKSH